MLTEDDVVAIQELKERGYAKARVAKTLRLSRATVSKYWGRRGERVSLSNLKRWFDECFHWSTCSRCALLYWAPKFLPWWQCPGCRTSQSWRAPHFKEKAKLERS